MVIVCPDHAQPSAGNGIREFGVLWQMDPGDEKMPPEPNWKCQTSTSVTKSLKDVRFTETIPGGNI